MFDLYALLLVPIIVMIFGLYGYSLKNTIFKTIKLNSYFLGLISYFALFELIYIPSVLTNMSFNFFFIIQLVVFIVITVLSLFKYTYDYRVKNINHKYRFLIRYKKHRYLFNTIYLILFVFIIISLFWPLTRFRDDEIHWLINIKDNIVHNNLMQTFSENGTYIKYSEMYVLNAFTVFESFVAKLSGVNIVALGFITTRFVLLFIVLFNAKDLYTQVYGQESSIRWSFTFFLILNLIWTSNETFYEIPHIIVFPVVAQRIYILILIPLITLIIRCIKNETNYEDVLINIIFALGVIFLSTSTGFIILAILISVLIIKILAHRSLKSCLGLIVQVALILVFLVTTLFIYTKTGPGKTILQDFMYKKYDFSKYNSRITYVSSYLSWSKCLLESYFIKFCIPILIVLFNYKKIKKFYIYLAIFLVLMSVTLNPITFKLFEKLNVENVFVRLNNYYLIFGYMLIYPALQCVVRTLNSKNDIVKIFQVLIFVYLTLSMQSLTSPIKRNVNVLNVQSTSMWSKADWDHDNYYYMDKYQVDVLKKLSDDNKPHYVTSTSSLLTNYRLRYFDSNAKVITPRNRDHWTYNYKNISYECLNSTKYISKENINVCKELVNHYDNSYVIVSRAYLNNFSVYLRNNFDEVYQNKKFILYKKGE